MQTNERNIVAFDHTQPCAACNAAFGWTCQTLDGMKLLEDQRQAKVTMLPASYKYGWSVVRLYEVTFDNCKLSLEESMLLNAESVKMYPHLIQQ